jgi:transcription initiation factor TFIIIB Brf1 subunit/transcription initiation factor TFIIB
MILVDCPICDHNVPFDPERGELDCAACGVLLPLAPAPEPELAAAA